MKITAQKLTNIALLREANEFTTKHTKTSNMSLETAYEMSHSPIRTQLWVIRMYDIPSATSVHLVRHAAVGQQHYVSSARPDLGYVEFKHEMMTHEEWRNTPVDHMMILNSQHLEEISWDRLCKKSSSETQRVMHLIRQAVKESDQALAAVMVPRCLYLGRCKEGKRSCGLFKKESRHA